MVAFLEQCFLNMTKESQQVKTRDEVQLRVLAICSLEKPSSLLLSGQLVGFGHNFGDPADEEILQVDPQPEN